MPALWATPCMQCCPHGRSPPCAAGRHRCWVCLWGRCSASRLGQQTLPAARQTTGKGPRPALLGQAAAARRRQSMCLGSCRKAACRANCHLWRRRCLQHSTMTQCRACLAGCWPAAVLIGVAAWARLCGLAPGRGLGLGQDQGLGGLLRQAVIQLRPCPEGRVRDACSIQVFGPNSPPAVYLWRFVPCKTGTVPGTALSWRSAH